MLHKKFNKIATMMPKPISMDSGSGMHTNVSIWKGQEKYLFMILTMEMELSQTWYDIFAEASLNHSKALCAISNPTTNSYHQT